MKATESAIVTFPFAFARVHLAEMKVRVSSGYSGADGGGGDKRRLNLLECLIRFIEPDDITAQHGGIAWWW